MKRTILFLCLPAVLAALLVGLGWRYGTAHTVEPSDLARVTVGMDWATASKTIGTNRKPVRKTDGSYFVALRKHDRWCMVDITLDSSLRVTSVFHDH